MSENRRGGFFDSHCIFLHSQIIERAWVSLCTLHHKRLGRPIPVSDNHVGPSSAVEYEAVWTGRTWQSCRGRVLDATSRLLHQLHSVMVERASLSQSGCPLESKNGVTHFLECPVLLCLDVCQRHIPELHQVSLPQTHTTFTQRHITAPLTLWRLYCCLKHPVPDRVRRSFVIFDIRALWLSAPSVIVPGCQKLQMTAKPGLAQDAL